MKKRIKLYEISTPFRHFFGPLLRALLDTLSKTFPSAKVLYLISSIHCLAPGEGGYFGDPFSKASKRPPLGGPRGALWGTLWGKGHQKERKVGKGGKPLGKGGKSGKTPEKWGKRLKSGENA